MRRALSIGLLAAVLSVNTLAAIAQPFVDGPAILSVKMGGTGTNGTSLAAHKYLGNNTTSTADAAYVQPVRADLTAQTGQKYYRELTLLRTLAGLPLDGTGGAGLFAVSTTATFGSPAAISLIGESTQNNTKTDAYEFEFTLPPEYVAGGAITVNVTANVSGSGTLGTTKTLTCDAFKVAAADGTVGSNLGPAAQVLATGAATTKSFTVTPTGLVAGDKLLIQVQASINETGNVSPIQVNVFDQNIAITVQG